MHIAFIEPHLELYGGIRRVLEFANRFVDRGARVTIYHPAGTPCAWMECKAGVQPLGTLAAHGHDVVIFNNPPDYRWARRARAKVKVHYILALYERDRLTRFHPGIFWPRKGRMMSLKRALQLPFVHVANATWIQSWLREHMGMNVERQLGGVNFDLFHPVDVARPDDNRGGNNDKRRQFVVLCSGDPRAHKGTATIRAALDRAKRTHPRVELRTYHGMGIPQCKMAATYCAADLFVDAQRYAGWNNPVVEAMACGVPVVCTNIGGVADFAFDGRTALLVAPDDPPALAHAIARMIDDRALRDRLATAAHAHVQRFRWDDAADGFLDLLARHLGAPRDRASR